MKLVQAIVSADDTGKMPPLTTARLLLQVLGVKDVDDTLRAAGMVDDEGQWIDPEVTAADVAVQAYRRGQDAAEVLR